MKKTLSLAAFFFAALLVGCKKEDPNENLAKLKKYVLAYYPFDGHLNDLTQNPANGVMYGQVSFTPDRQNQPAKALLFSGGYVDIGSPTKLHFAKNQPFSMAGWIRIGAGPNDGRFFSAENPEGNLRMSVIHPNNYYLRFNFGNSYVTSKIVLPDIWLSYVFVYDGNKSQVFVNGILEDDNNITNHEDREYADMRFGQKAAPAFDPFYGALDEIVFFKKALTEQEIKWLYNSGNLWNK